LGRTLRPPARHRLEADGFDHGEARGAGCLLLKASACDLWSP
jgi:hypothetical protein